MGKIEYDYLPCHGCSQQGEKKGLRLITESIGYNRKGNPTGIKRKEYECSLGYDDCSVVINANRQLKIINDISRLENKIKNDSKKSVRKENSHKCPKGGGTITTK